MAIPQVFAIPILNTDTFVAIPCQNQDNLPSHVKGTAEFRPQGGLDHGYYIPTHGTQPAPKPVEFINNSWYSLVINGCQTKYCT
jgi:hypothetical protein